MARTSRSNIGCRRFRKTSRSVSSSTLPSCDGGSNATIRNSSRRSGWDILKDGLARLPPSRHPLHCGLRIPDLRARKPFPPPRRSCHHAVPAICLTRRSPAPQRIRRCGLNATFRTRLQRCDGDWWPLLPRRSHVAHAAPLGTDTRICDTVRLAPTSRPNCHEFQSDSAFARVERVDQSRVPSACILNCRPRPQTL